jgi:hypothetical protein
VLRSRLGLMKLACVFGDCGSETVQFVQLKNARLQQTIQIGTTCRYHCIPAARHMAWSMPKGTTQAANAVAVSARCSQNNSSMPNAKLTHMWPHESTRALIDGWPLETQRSHRTHTDWMLRSHHIFVMAQHIGARMAQHMGAYKEHINTNKHRQAGMSAACMQK